MNRVLHEFLRQIAKLVHNHRLQSRLQAGSAIALGIGLLLSTTLLTGIFTSFQNRLCDLLYRPAKPSGQVVLVEIDNASLEEIGAWPWPRETLANLFDVIAAAQPRVVGLDIVLPDPADDDPALARAFQRLPHIVHPVLAVDATRLSPNPGAFLRYNAALTSSSSLKTSNARFGHTLVTEDSDGIVRRLPAVIDVSGDKYLAFGISVLGDIYPTEIRNGYLTAGIAQLPLDARGQLNLGFGDPSGWQVLSAGNILNRDSDLSILKNKIVLVGLAGPDLTPSFQTPLTFGDRRVSSLEIQADLVETLLGNRDLVEQDRLVQVTMIFLVALLAGATLPHVGLLSAAGLTILYFLFYLGYAFDKFGSGILVQPLYPALALVLTFAGTMTFRYFAEDRQRDFIARLFRRYVASESVGQVVTVFDRGAMQLAGTRRKATLLWVDLRPLSDLTETLPAQALVKLLNQHVERIAKAIFHRSGSIAKQSGDSMLAVWNLPLDQGNHAQLAVLAAMDIQQDLSKLAADLPKEMEIRIGMGIATGDVVAGYVGAANCTEYALVGQVVAVAERLATNYEHAILMDAETHTFISDDSQTREAKPMRLRGKTESIPVWEVCEPMVLEAITEPDR